MIRRLVVCIILVNFLPGRTDAACSNKEQFQCVSDQKCIDQELTCNGLNDCADGSDERLNCTNGCLFNKTQIIKAGETGQDNDWWYTCNRSRWVISGCVANGQRYKAGETFQLVTRQGIYWGKCERLDQYRYMRQPYGCVDQAGRNVENGQNFQMNLLFWGVCSSTPIATNTPDIGKVNVNDVKWKIVGCNDGSQNAVQDGQEFIWIIDPFRLLGVQIRCHVPNKQNEWPDTSPTACVVNVPSSTAPANGQNSAPVFKLLPDKCYLVSDKLIYYCTISPRTSTIPPEHIGKVSMWDSDWLLNVTEYNAQEVGNLQQKGFSECAQSPKVQPVVPKIPLPPPLPPQQAAGNQGAQPQSNQPTRGNANPSANANAHPNPNANNGAAVRGKREIVRRDAWRKVKRSAGHIRSLLSPRISSQQLADSIVV